MQKNKLITLVLIVLALPGLNYAQISMPPVFSDAMVLQRHKPIPVWGKAEDNASLSVHLTDAKGNTIASSQGWADKDGRWEVHLQAVEAGGPYRLVVTTREDTLQLQNVLVGEVWVASGQSNMAFPLRSGKHGQEAIEKANYPQIRLFRMERKYSQSAQAFSKAQQKKINAGDFYRTVGWEKCTPDAASSFSAVAFYFARRIHQKLGIPVGIIQNAVGGSPTQAW